MRVVFSIARFMSNVAEFKECVLLLLLYLLSTVHCSTLGHSFDFVEPLQPVRSHVLCAQ